MCTQVDCESIVERHKTIHRIYFVLNIAPNSDLNYFLPVPNK